MLTLEETLASQNDLFQLCADRPLKTNEICRANAFYGIDTVLKRYAGLPQSYALKVVVPHGLHFTEDYVWESEAKALVPAVWCYPPYRERAYVSRTNKKVILSASPFVYVVEMLKNQPRPTRRGTIFFPAHSTHWNTVHMDFDCLAEELTHLDDEYKPITVCIYWRDFNLGRHIPFQERGLPIVSAGHIYDSDFLYRFYHLCSMHRYAASNGLGSHIFYSVKAGCSFFYFDKVGYSSEIDRKVYPDGLPKAAPAVQLVLKSLFGVPRPSMTAEQLKTVDYYLGASYLKSPQDLKQRLLYAERLDKVGFWVRNNGGGAHLTFPTYYRRLWRSLLSKLPVPVKQSLKQGRAWWRAFRNQA